MRMSKRDRSGRTMFVSKAKSDASCNDLSVSHCVFFYFQDKDISIVSVAGFLFICNGCIGNRRM